MFKLVGFDLDGTLLNNNREISSITCESLKGISKFILPVIVTGRGFYSASKFFKDLNINIDIISNNGNIIRNALNNRLYYVNEINKREALEIIKYCDEFKDIYPLVHINAFEEGYDIATIVKDCNEYVKRYPKGFGNRTQYLNSFSELDFGILSIVFAGEYEDLFKLNDLLYDKYKDNFNIHLCRSEVKKFIYIRSFAKIWK